MVDFLTHCYESTWRLFKDDLTKTTRGRYYFAPAGTPHVPVAHNFWSRNNTPRELLLGPTLGEDINVRQKFTDGTPPPVIPLNRVVGSLLCLTQGESSNNILPPDQFEGGFNKQCFLPDITEVNRLRAFSTYSCSTQYFYAVMLSAMYRALPEYIRGAFRLLLSNPLVNWHTGTTYFPDVVTVKAPGVNVVLIDGTQNWQQLALQAFYNIQNPQNWGAFATSPLYYYASSYVLNYVNQDELDPSVPTLFVGHSYGGSVAMICAARMKLVPNRDVRFITYGAPKPGDEELRLILDRTLGFSLVDYDDPVPMLPPTFQLLDPVMEFLSLPILSNWANWKFPPAIKVMDQQGQLTSVIPFVPDYPTLLFWTQRILASQPLSSAIGHNIDIYARRITTRCPNPEWPISQELWNYLNNIPAGGGVEIAGRAILSFRSRGGAVIAGAADVTPFILGGAAVSGSAILPPGPRGGVELSGAAVLPPGPRGGVELSGKCTFTITTGGGTEISGAVVFPPTPQGGVELSGAAVLPPVPLGGVEVSGAAF